MELFKTRRQAGQDIKDAELRSDQLKQIEEVESKLGISLVAVNA